MTLGDAASLFLASLSNKEREQSRQVVNYLVRWFGWDRVVSGLMPAEIEGFTKRLSATDTDYTGKIRILRRFLNFLYKEGWTSKRLASCLRVAGNKPPPKHIQKGLSSEKTVLTPEGERRFREELESLKKRRPQIVKEVQRAAADKDFKENAPYHAAREQLSLLDGRISEIEAILGAAVVVNANDSCKVGIGSTVTVANVDNGEEARYMLVSPGEVDIRVSKISVVSPLGRAVLDKRVGRVVEVQAPQGKCRYKIKAIE